MLEDKLFRICNKEDLTDFKLVKEAKVDLFLAESEEHDSLVLCYSWAGQWFSTGWITGEEAKEIVKQWNPDNPKNNLPLFFGLRHS